MAYPATSLNFGQQAPSRMSEATNSATGLFEDLLGLHEAACLLGMHWKTLEGMYPSEEPTLLAAERSC
jgi:hypothetical protein